MYELHRGKGVGSKYRKKNMILRVIIIKKNCQSKLATQGLHELFVYLRPITSYPQRLSQNGTQFPLRSRRRLCNKVVGWGSGCGDKGW